MSLDEIRDKVILKDTDPNKGAMLTLYSDDVELIEQFKGLCLTNLPKSLSWFHQCNTSTFQMFEFWKPQTETMVAHGFRIARELGLSFKTELSKPYGVGESVEIRAEDFKPFDPDMHTFNDFFGG